MIDLDNLKPSWMHYKQRSGNYSRLNEEDILGMLSSRKKKISTPFSSRLLMNFCVSALLMFCCTGC